MRVPKRSGLVMILTLIPMLMFSSSLIGTVMANGPTLTVTKSVSPTNIYLAGLGETPEYTTVTINVTGYGGVEWAPGLPIDVVFALDSSLSMWWNDPGDLRLDAAKNFTDKLNATVDQGGVVSWDGSIDFTYGLTNDFSTTPNVGLKWWIDQVDSSGWGTNLDVGLAGAIAMLDANTRVDPSSEVIIFLTNGEGSYTFYGNGGPIDDAVANGYVVYSIGLDLPAGSAVDRLIDMANATGGNYYDSPTAENLQDIFDDIFAAVITYTAPTNVDVIEVTQDYILDESGYSIAPDSVVENLDNTTTITWNNVSRYVGNLDARLNANETFTVSFQAKCNLLGDNLPVDVYGEAVVNFTDPSGNPGSVNSPQAYINVITVAQLKYYLTVKTDPPGLSPAPTPPSNWYDNCTYVNLTAPEYANVSADTRYRFDYWDVNGTSQGANVRNITVHMDANYTATAHYGLQYLVTFNQTGLDGTANSAVVTVNGAPKNFSDLPFSMWVDNGSSVTYNYSDIVSSSVLGKRFRLDSISSPPSPFTVTGPVTITGNYKTQYLLTVRTNGLGTNSTDVYNGTTTLGTATDATPYSDWFDEDSSLLLNIDSPITVGSTKFVFTQWSGAATGTSRPLPLTMNSAKDITANYKTQYEVTFSQSGVDTDFTGTVVTIDGTGYNVTDLPVSFWWDKNSQHNFSFASPLVVNASKQYVWFSTSGLSTSQSDDTFTITSSGSVVGNYSTGIKYQITFDQTGVDSDFNDTIVTVDGTPYNRTTLPVSFLWDEGSIHNFAFQSPLVVTSNAKQYLWNYTSGLSSLQTGSITVSMSGSVVGNYKTQYYLTMSTNFGTVTPGDGWHDAGSNVSINATSPSAGPGERYVWNGWTGTGTGSYSGMAKPTSVTMNGPITETASWTHEYRLTMATNYGTTSPSVGDHWYAEGSIVQINATAPSVGAGERYVWNGWTGTGTGSYSGTDKPASITMNSPITETASWTHEYYLTVLPSHGTPGGSGWYEEGATAYASVTPLTVPGPTGVRYVFTHWSGDASGSSSPSNPITMSGPKTAVANWKTQYKLTVKTDPLGLSPGPTPPTDWYDESADVALTAQTVSGYSFNYWDVDGGLQGVGVNPITVHMDGPHTATAHYQTVAPPPPPAVGGYALPITLELGASNSLIPWIGLASALLATAAATIILVSRRKKTSRWER